MIKMRKTVIDYFWKSLVLIISGLVFVKAGDVYGSTVDTIPLVWLPAGIFIALIFFWGYRFLPAVYLSTFIAYTFIGHELQPSLLVAATSTVEVFFATFLLKRIFRVNPALVSVRDVIYLLFSSILASFVSSGFYSLIYSIFYSTSNSLIVFSWALWWINDLLSILLLLPLFMVWGTDPPTYLKRTISRIDWVSIPIALIVTWFIFQQHGRASTFFNTQSYLLFPFLMVIALRLLQRGTTLASLGIGIVGIAILYQHNSVIGNDVFLDVWILGAFLIAVSMTSMIMAALFAERETANDNLKELNVKLEERVAQRTNELKTVNVQLKHELKSRQEAETDLIASEDSLRTIIDNIPDAFILLNSAGEIIDINNNLMSLFRLSRDEILHHYRFIDLSAQNMSDEDLGKNYKRVMNGEVVKFEWLARRPSDNSIFPVEIELKRIRLDKEFNIIGSIRDLTERINIMNAEHEQRILAEALQNTAAALSSVQNLDEVFDKILKNVGSVVPHDAVNLMLIEDGMARIVHSHGYKKLGMLEYIRDVRFEVDNYVNLRTMVETGQPIIISDVNKYPEWNFDERASWIQSYAGAPIQVNGETIGFIQLDSGTPGYFQKEHSARLQAFAYQAAVAIENARLYTELQKLAITDNVTGLLNRHGFNPTSKREFVIARRYNRKISVILFDIDHLKNINDVFGHPVGDRALIMIADCCRSTIREVDLVARFGGDEFVILLSETDLTSGLEVAARLKHSIQGNLFEVDGQIVAVTISAGVAEIKKGMKSLDELIDTADRGSYLAKSQGRDSIATVQSIPRKARAKLSMKNPGSN
jgi:diguanylate cyclase (GGDEF)-like protein/PAS domain S-box-containing protein